MSRMLTLSAALLASSSASLPETVEPPPLERPGGDNRLDLSRAGLEQALARPEDVGMLAAHGRSRHCGRLRGPVAAAEPQPQAQHRISLQVSNDDLAAMSLALANVENIAKYYASTGESVAVDLTAFGPGFTMLRADRSPVKDRLADVKRRYPFVVFSRC